MIDSFRDFCMIVIDARLAAEDWIIGCGVILGIVIAVVRVATEDDDDMPAGAAAFIVTVIGPIGGAAVGVVTALLWPVLIFATPLGLLGVGV